MKLTQLQRSRKQRIIIRDNSTDGRKVPTLPSLQPDVVPSLKYHQEISSVDISRRQFQYATTQLNLGETHRTAGISSGTQTSVLNIPITSQTRPVIIQSLVDTLTSGEPITHFVDIETLQATDLVLTEDRGMDLDISEITNTVETAESTPTDSIVQVSVEVQTEKSLTITEISQTDFPEELQTSVSPQSISEDTYIKIELSKGLGTSVSTQTFSLETQTISTETELTTVISVPVQTEELPEKTFVTASNLETNSKIHKTVIGRKQQPLQPKSHMPILISSSISEFSSEEDISTPLPTSVMDSDISVEEFTELQISVATQTDCSTSFPLAMMSPMRQFQFSIPAVFPSGSLLSRSSPMRTLLMPLGMICF
jgi:hypothetical protein